MTKMIRCQKWLTFALTTKKGYKFANAEVEKISSLLVDKYCTQNLCQARVTKLIKIYALFQTKPAQKPYPAGCTYIYSLAV